MAAFQILIQYRPKGGADCQSIDHYQSNDETEGEAEIFNDAVDYIHNLIQSGAKYSKKNGLCASAADYDIIVGPTLGQLD